MLVPVLAQAQRAKEAVTCDWGLLATLGLPILAFCLTTLRLAFGSDDRLQEKYGSRRQAARAKLHGEQIVPGLARLLAAPFDNDPDRLLDSIASGESLDYVLEVELASVDYLEELARLSELYADHNGMDRHQDQARTYDRRQIPVLLVLLVAGCYWAVTLALSNSPLPSWTSWAAGICALAALVTVLVFIGLSLAACNDLARLLRRYE